MDAATPRGPASAPARIAGRASGAWISAAARRARPSVWKPVKLLKLIWDFIGTEYGGRQLQYEMFYSAAQPVVNRRMFRAYDWRSATAMVDRLLGEY